MCVCECVCVCVCVRVRVCVWGDGGHFNGGGGKTVKIRGVMRGNGRNLNFNPPTQKKIYAFFAGGGVILGVKRCKIRGIGSGR